MSGVDSGHCSCQQQCLVNIIRISHDTDLVTSVSGRRRHIIDTDHVMDIINILTWSVMMMFMIKCNLSKYFLSQVLTDLYSPWNSLLCWYQLWLLLLSHNSNPLSELINIYSTQADTIYDAWSWSDLWKEKATFIKCLSIVSLDYVHRILWTISGGQWKREILYLQSIVVSQTIFSLSCVSVSR